MPLPLAPFGRDPAEDFASTDFSQPPPAPPPAPPPERPAAAIPAPPPLPPGFTLVGPAAAPEVSVADIPAPPPLPPGFTMVEPAAQSFDVGRAVLGVPAELGKGWIRGFIQTAASEGPARMWQTKEGDIGTLDAEIAAAEKRIVDRKQYLQANAPRPRQPGAWEFVRGIFDEEGVREDMWNRWHPGDAKARPEDRTELAQEEANLASMKARRDAARKEADEWRDTYDRWERASMTGWLEIRPDENWLEHIARVGGQAGSSLAISLGTSYLTGNPLIGAAALGELQGMGEWVKARREGLSTAEANRAYLLETALATATEWVPLEFFKRAGAGRVFRRYLVNGSVEALQETVDTLKTIGLQYAQGYRGDALLHVYDEKAQQWTQKDVRWKQEVWDAIIGGFMASGQRMLGESAMTIVPRAKAYYAARAPLADMETGEAFLRARNDGVSFERKGDVLVATLPGGATYVFGMVKDDSVIEIDPVKFYESVAGHNPEVAADALAEAKGDKKRAGEILRETQELTGATTKDAVLIAPDGSKVRVSALMRLVAGRATIGTLSEEEFHALVLIAGAEGHFKNEEALAAALSNGVDHPTTEKIRQTLYRVTNLFRSADNARETQFQTANRILAKMRLRAMTVDGIRQDPEWALPATERVKLDEERAARAKLMAPRTEMDPVYLAEVQRQGLRPAVPGVEGSAPPAAPAAVAGAEENLDVPNLDQIQREGLAPAPSGPVVARPAPAPVQTPAPVVVPATGQPGAEAIPPPPPLPPGFTPVQPSVEAAPAPAEVPGLDQWQRLGPQYATRPIPAPVPEARTTEGVDQPQDIVPSSGLRLLHGSKRADLSLDQVVIMREGGQKQNRNGRKYGGFYATSVADEAQARGYAGKEGTVYSIEIDPGTRIFREDGDVTRLTHSRIQELVNQGYGVLVGKDPRGRTEYVVLNTKAIKALAPVDQASVDAAQYGTRPRQFGALDEKYRRALAIGDHAEARRLVDIAESMRTPTAEMEDRYYSFTEQEERIAGSMVAQFKKRKSQSWDVVPIGRLAKIWNDYASTGVVRDVRGLDEIADRVVQNIAALQVNTVLVGHTPMDPVEYLSNLGINVTQEQADRLANWVGEGRYSDYAMEPLVKDATSILAAKTAEEKLLAVDRALSRIHMRGDIAGLFVEGGTASLNKLASRPELPVIVRNAKGDIVSLEERFGVSQDARFAVAPKRAGLPVYASTNITIDQPPDVTGQPGAEGIPPPPPLPPGFTRVAEAGAPAVGEPGSETSQPMVREEWSPKQPGVPEPRADDQTIPDVVVEHKARVVRDLGLDGLSISDAVTGTAKYATRAKGAHAEWFSRPNMKTEDWDTVNNRLAKEWQIIRGLLGADATAKVPTFKVALPADGGTVDTALPQDQAEVIRSNLGKFRSMIDAPTLVDAAVQAQIVTGAEAAILRKRMPNEAGINDRVLGNIEKEGGIDPAKVRVLRDLFALRNEKSGYARNNGKAGHSSNLCLFTCNPSEKCLNCYAARVFFRMSSVRKQFHDTIAQLLDPVQWGKDAAAEWSKMPKWKEPFIRLQGSGDLVFEEQVVAYNALAQHADRPIQVFSRSHPLLLKLKGTQTAPFVKMASIDSQLVAEYGMDWVVKNPTRGLANAYLYADPETDIPILKALAKKDAVQLILAASDKLHAQLPLSLRMMSCPCDAGERSYVASCRRCALSNAGCFMAYAAKGVDADGRMWDIMDPKAPQLKPITAFVGGEDIPRSWAFIAQTILKKSRDQIVSSGGEVKKYLSTKPKERKDYVRLRDIRRDDRLYIGRVKNDDGTWSVVAERGEEGWGDNPRVVLAANVTLKEANAMVVGKAKDFVKYLEALIAGSKKGTFWLAGGEIQSGVAYVGMKPVEQGKPGDPRLKEQGTFDAGNGVTYATRTKVTPEQNARHAELARLAAAGDKTAEAEAQKIVDEAAKAAGQMPFSVFGHPAFITRNTIPGEKPWRITFAEEGDPATGALGHFQLNSPTQRSVLEDGQRVDIESRFSAFTYRDDGTLIPLSERFNDESNDIRYATRTKIHQTVQRVTGEPGMATLPSDPAASYEVQSLDTIEAEVAKMKPWEQEAALAELDRIGSTPSAENRAGVIHAKRIMDFHAAGDLAAARAEVLRASRNIGVAAQLVRQAALIRGSTPEGMVFVVEEMAHDKGGELSPADRARLGTLALIDITARSATKAAEQAFETTPNPTTARALDAARLAAAKAHIRFATEASTMVPKWWSDILRMMIQGSSMSGRSIVNNLYGNYANAIPRFVQHTIAASLDGAGKAIGLWSDRQVGQPAMDAAAYVRGMVDSIRNDVLPIVKTGMTAQHLPVSGEVYQGFQPVGSVRRLATAETLTANQKAKLLVEATFGLPAEVIFRALQLGDALPRSGAYAAHLNEIARTTEALTGPAREKWLKAPPQWAQDLAMERAAEQVYQESSKITKGIVSIASAGAKGNAAQRMFNALVWRPGVMLFAATPANLAQQGAGFLAPHLALAECVWKAAHGDRRGALLAAGKAITGCMMYGAAGLLVRLGVVGGNPKDDKEAALQRETGVDPLNLNVSGMMRAKRKESPAWQPNDVQVSYRNLGFFGQVLNIVASGEDQILRDSYMAGGEIDLEPSTLSLAIAGAINVPSALLDLSMMKGTYSLLDSIMRRDYDNWFTAWMGTVANGVLPATLAQANAATRDWMPEKRYRGPGGASVLGSSIESNVRTVINDLKTRVWMADDLPPMRGLYGEKIPSTPPGANPIIYHMIDPLRARRDPGNPYAVEVARVYDATLEKRAIPPVPKGLDRVAFTDSRGRARVFKLTGRQYERMQALHGMFLRAGTRQLLSMEDYLSAPALAQARYLSAMNEAAREAARQRLAEEIRRGLR